MLTHKVQIINYLAHAYLSFDDPEILVGNLISDFVKGKKKFDYPPGIQKGIALHRAIDSFTDKHDATKRANDIFRPYYRLYSGALTDVAFDHFLARDENEFSETSLFDFSQRSYEILEAYREWLPEKFASMFSYMKSQNWLFNYRTTRGIQKSFGGVVHRAAYLTDSETAGKLFEQHYQQFAEYYRHFWQDMKLYARRQYEMMNESNNR